MDSIPTELKSLSLFFLPKHLIASLDLPTLLTPHSLPSTSDNNNILPTTLSTELGVPATNPSIPQPSSSLSTSITPSCRVCGIARLDSVEQQRQHVKSEWHRYNLKQKILNKSAQPIQELHFNKLAAKLLLEREQFGTKRQNNIGSNHRSYKKHHHKIPSRRTITTKDADYSTDFTAIATSDTVNEEGTETLMESLLRDLEISVREQERARLADPLRIAQQQALEQQRQKARASPMIWFTTSLHGTTTPVRLGVYKNAMANKGQCEDPKAYLESVQIHVAPIPPKKPRIKRAARAKLLLEQQQQQQRLEQEQREQQVQQQQQEQEEIQEQTTSNDIMDEEVSTPTSKQQEQQLNRHADSAANNNNKTNTLLRDPKLSPPRYWTIFLLGGGHFAGMVVDLTGHVKRFSRVREIKVEVHKGFHRYTVRKKNGGAQSSMGFANSAGGMVRMYNDRALKVEVRDLLDSWAEWIQKSECVFMHAPGNNRRTVIYDGSVIAAAEIEGRLRSIPFVTRRPTFTEIKRCYHELTSVKVSTLSSEELEAMEEAEKEAMEKAAAELGLEDQDQDNDSDDGGDNVMDEGDWDQKQQSEGDDRPRSWTVAQTQKLINLVRKGRTDTLSTYIRRHNINPSQLLPTTSPLKKEYDFNRTPTLLHIASHYGQVEVVRVLLEEHLADPTVTSYYSASTTTIGMNNDDNDEDHDSSASRPGAAAELLASSMTAYEVAKDKETRNIFRRAMAKMPTRWEWRLLARVPAPLTPEMESKAKGKSKRQLEGKRERRQKRQLLPRPAKEYIF
ncbi:hypothetical protein BG004_001188 [Podila humilis]|nr:hypothetical protein BG004_001188 [Podila humilis]